MSAMSRNRKADPMQKRIPLNPRYANVKSQVDSGVTATVDEIKHGIKYRSGELFKRMKVTTFVQLVMQVGEEQYRTSAADGRGDLDLDDDFLETDRIPDTAGGGDGTQRSTLQSVIGGVGELDLDPTDTSRRTASPEAAPLVPNPNYSPPYLLLDVRPHDDWQRCHIISAFNYPSAMIARSCNSETKDLLDYKNQPGKVILVYDDEEKVATLVASTLVERGYDNLFLITGGLKQCAKLFPKGLVVGSLPESAGGKRETRQLVCEPRPHFDLNDLAQLDMKLDEIFADKNDSKGIGTRLSRATTSASRATTSASSRIGSGRDTVTRLGETPIPGRPAFK